MADRAAVTCRGAATARHRGAVSVDSAIAGVGTAISNSAATACGGAAISNKLGNNAATGCGGSATDCGGAATAWGGVAVVCDAAIASGGAAVTSGVAILVGDFTVDVVVMAGNNSTGDLSTCSADE